MGQTLKLARLWMKMSFEALAENSTLVKIRESGWEKINNPLMKTYCKEWMQILCCLVQVEDDKNLREFFFLTVSATSTEIGIREPLK